MEYPKWVKVSGAGHPQNPGYALVSSADEEREAVAKGAGPAALNPPPDPGQKALADMDRDELKSVLMREGIPDDMTDDDIRSAIELGRERRAEHAREDAEEAKREEETRKAGGDHGDGMQTTDVPAKDKEAPSDAAGDKIAPDTADEANKGDATVKRTAPKPKATPATDARPDDAKDKVADDKPAGNVTEVAAQPKDDKKGSTATK